MSSVDKNGYQVVREEEEDNKDEIKAVGTFRRVLPQVIKYKNRFSLAISLLLI